MLDLSMVIFIRTTLQEAVREGDRFAITGPIHTGRRPPPRATEPLDADWLARVANDPTYITVGSDTNVVASGKSVYQSGQTAGMYCNSTTSTLNTCFEQVTSTLLRLTQ